MTNDSSSTSLEALVDEFIARHRRGESAAELEAESASRYPELADEIHELFPTIATVETLKTQREREVGVRASLCGVTLERLGDFRLLREIGRGGMGVVFEAEQDSLHRRVALKVLPKQALLDPRHAARFRREAETAARLVHANIVPVFGAGEQDGFQYFVMQFISGTGLDNVIEQLRGGAPNLAQAVTDSLTAERLAVGGLSSAPTEQEILGAVFSRAPRLSKSRPSEPALRAMDRDFFHSVAKIGEQIALALDYAHSQGVLHRDIKPSNLLLDDRGVTWIADFGLARATEHVPVTQTGELVGTLRYLAPERLQGQADARSDIYSLGLTLYELLTWVPAFTDTDRFKLLQRIAEASPPPPSKLVSNLPRDLEAIVLKSIARDPQCRYATALEMADDLRRFLSEIPVQARRATAQENSRRWFRGDRKWAVTTATVVVLLVIVTVAASIGYVRARREVEELSALRAKAESALRLAEDRLREAHSRENKPAPDPSP